MPSVYVETTIPSYLAAQPSRDLIVAAHQQITHDWWRHARERFDLFISVAVLNEIQAGDPALAAHRLDIVAGLTILESNEEIQDLVGVYERRLGFEGTARADLPHLAFAVAYELDYLVTWNCAHLANGEIIRRLLEVNADLHRATPLIVTPEEILESPEGGNR